jgi:hypothetical protein
MGNFELFKVSGKIRFKSSKSNLLYAESAFIELNPVGLAMKIIIMLVHLNQKYTAKPLNLNSVDQLSSV